MNPDVLITSCEDVPVLLENVNDETFSVEKIVQFYRGHQALDQAFGWGMRWTPGRK